MSHVIQADLTDLKGLAAALKDLEWYVSPAGGYRLAGVTVTGNTAAWALEPKSMEEKAAQAAKAPERRRVAEPGDQVIVETKGQQMARRFGGAAEAGVEGTVFRVLTRGPHPHGMKVELRDRSVGRIKQNLTMPGAGEPAQK